jgi:hypothetical protein
MHLQKHLLGDFVRWRAHDRKQAIRGRPGIARAGLVSVDNLMAGCHLPSAQAPDSPSEAIF